MAEAPIDLTNTSDEDDPPPKRQRGGAGSSSAPGAWHPAVRAQAAGAQLELPDGSSIERAGVSAKALICLDRLAVLYGSLRAAYDKGYRYYRTPVQPPFHRNEFTLPGSSQRMSAGPFVVTAKIAGSAMPASRAAAAKLWQFSLAAHSGLSWFELLTCRHRDRINDRWIELRSPTRRPSQLSREKNLREV